MESINWELVIITVLGILLLFAGGYIRKLAKEAKELIDAIASAIEDDTMDDKELAVIIKELKDVGKSIKEIILALRTGLGR